jgi:hypothetical protein
MRARRDFRWAWRDTRARPGAPIVAGRYMAAIAAGNLAWEFLHLPLYTLWRSASSRFLAFAAFHCWLGDMLIAAICLAIAIFATGRVWPWQDYGRTAVMSVLLGVGYTVFSEWLHVGVRASWAYAPVMPRVPPLGTGLSPLLQWILVPTIAFLWARRARPVVGTRLP